MRHNQFCWCPSIFFLFFFCHTKLEKTKKENERFAAKDRVNKIKNKKNFTIAENNS
jgi:hypothetical protein